MIAKVQGQNYESLPLLMVFYATVKLVLHMTFMISHCLMF